MTPLLDLDRIFPAWLAELRGAGYIVSRIPAERRRLVLAELRRRGVETPGAPRGEGGQGGADHGRAGRMRHEESGAS